MVRFTHETEKRRGGETEKNFYRILQAYAWSFQGNGVPKKDTGIEAPQCLPRYAGTPTRRYTMLFSPIPRFADSPFQGGTV